MYCATLSKVIFISASLWNVKMEHYCALLTEEEKHITGLRVVPKLKQAHVMPNSFQKMTVCLATQVTQTFFYIKTLFSLIKHKISTILQ